ncbi:MAG TPA: hypothetical protein VFN90_10085 [Gemmatimonadales bacterium]|nr:hypothetical protein [Gemmatimonadales bacterium]
MRTQTLLLAAVIALAACGDKAPAAAPVDAPSVPEVLPNIPLPPEGEVVSEGTGSDARSLIISTPVADTAVIRHYRAVLGVPPFRLINEDSTAAGISFYAEQDGPSIWVVVRGLQAGGTLVTIAGARPDTAFRNQPAISAPIGRPAGDTIR